MITLKTTIFRFINGQAQKLKNPLLAVCLPISPDIPSVGLAVGAEFAVVLAALGASHADWIIASLDHFIVALLDAITSFSAAFLDPFRAIAAAILAALRPGSLCKIQER